MKSKRVKGRNWTDKETKAFIKLCGDYNVLAIKDGRLATNIEGFKIIEAKMSSAGFDQTAKQLQIKFKQLKSQYYKATNEITYGDSNTRFNYYEEMNALVATAGLAAGALPGVAGNGLADQQNFTFDGAEDNDTNDGSDTIDYFETATTADAEETFQFDGIKKEEEDSVSNASTETKVITPRRNPKRKTKSKNIIGTWVPCPCTKTNSSAEEQCSSGRHEQPKRAKDIPESTKSSPAVSTFHAYWYKQQAKLQSNFFEEQRELIKLQKQQIQKQFFEEQLKLQEQQQKWMERMIREERQNLNEQLRIMMCTFMEGIHKLNGSENKTQFKNAQKNSPNSCLQHASHTDSSMGLGSSANTSNVMHVPKVNLHDGDYSEDHLNISMHARYMDTDNILTNQSGPGDRMDLQSKGAS